SSWSGQSTVSKFAQASALEKISSGRWQTKPVQLQVDVEVIRQSDSPNSLYGRESDSCGSMNLVSDREYTEATLLKHVERGLAIEEGARGSFKDVSGVEMVHSPVQSPVLFTNDGQPAYPDSSCGGPLLQQPPEVSERPKLKLLPRTKPLDVQEPSIVDCRQGLQQSVDNSLLVASNIHGNTNHVKSRPSSSEARSGKPGVSGSEAAGHQVVERPKLNLKPRVQPVHQSDGNAERERIKNDTHRAEVAPGHAIASRQGESNHLNDQRTGRGHEKRGQRADMQRKNWRNDNWRSGRDTEKHHQERQPSPESWRKPIEQPTDNSGLRFGKAVSAVDLAQAFSKPISSPKPVDQFSGQRGVPTKKGLPARSQVPFSRLAETTTRPQINGY
ncbi:Thionin BTH7, partial [Bienertia sinuspersici]